MKQTTKRILSIILVLLIAVSISSIILWSSAEDDSSRIEYTLIMYRCWIYECNETYLHEKNTTVTYLNETFLDSYPKYKLGLETAFNTSVKQKKWRENLRFVTEFYDYDLVYPEFPALFSKEDLLYNRPVYEYQGKYFVLFHMPEYHRTDGAV